LIVQASARHPLFLVENLKIGREEHPVLLDSRGTCQIAVSDLNNFAINTSLIEHLGQLREVLVNTKSPNNHLGFELGAWDELVRTPALITTGIAIVVVLSVVIVVVVNVVVVI
jgi:hypothetical protein